MFVKAATILLLLWSASMLRAQQEEVAPPNAPNPPPGVAEKPKPAAPIGLADLDQNLQSLVRQLAHDEFKQRMDAQEKFLEWGMEDLPRGIDTLYAIYRESDDPEVRLRSREVLKRLVIVRQPWDGEGYLGIQMDTGHVRGEDGIIRTAVLIKEVREGTGAEDAKLQIGDLITAVDKVVLNDLVPTQAFSEYIKSKKPGDIVTLQVRRGREALALKASLRRRSPLLNQLPQWGGLESLPAQAELDESDFREWLRERIRAEKRANRE